jgi:hypothetical protein
MRSLVFFVCLAAASPAFAQEQGQPQPPADEKVDATKMGVSLSRIQRGLFIAAEREKRTADGLPRLEFNIQVYGMAPKIEVLKGVDLSYGAVPGTAPTHGQMIEFWTPPIYRSPGLPISSLAYWVANQIWEKSRKTRCEEEIASYRALVMQGVSVSAPRCSQ